MYFTNSFSDGTNTFQIIIKKLENGIISIPVDEGNEQYMEYLAWLAEGNTPEKWTGE